eukprot:gene4292-8532_t
MTFGLSSFISPVSNGLCKLNSLKKPIALHFSSSDFTDLSTLALSVVSPWSVSGSTLNASDIAAQLFSVSLLPYLVLLFFLARPQTNTPKLGNFGFQFLLAFVFATIPAGIYAKTAYHDILANVDWLHGGAESLLTITNLLIVYGFRKSRSAPTSDKNDISNVTSQKETTSVSMQDMGLPILLALIVLSSSTTSFFPHSEPSNALSIPTWMVHVSSIQEWLLAMKYIWEHSYTSGNPRWKGMTWGMLPSQASGMCACTYHFFYNSPLINWIVALQALLTVFGNSTMAYSAYRIFQFENSKSSQTTDPSSGTVSGTASDTNVLPSQWTSKPLEESDKALAIKILGTSIIGAILVKYGELFLDLPFDPQWYAPLAIIGTTTFSVASLYAFKSIQEPEPMDVTTSNPIA